MTLDFSRLSPSKEDLVFTNIITSDFTVTRHETPLTQPRIGRKLKLGPRQSPFRTESNMNFLLDENDFYITKPRPDQTIDALYEANSVVEGKDLDLIRKSVERVKIEKKIRQMAK